MDLEKMGQKGVVKGCEVGVKRGQKILTIRTTVSNYESAKKALWKASVKLPTPGTIVVEKGQELVG